MKLTVVIHQAEEGGYWAEVPSIPGCATQGETYEELLKNVYGAIDGCLSIKIPDVPVSETDRGIPATSRCVRPEPSRALRSKATASM